MNLNIVKLALSRLIKRAQYVAKQEVEDDILKISDPERIKH